MAEYGFTVSVTNLASVKMKEIEESLASMGVKAKVETKEVAEDFEFMGERMGDTFKNLKSLLLTGLGITALFEGWEFIEKSKEAFEGLEKAVTRVDTVVKSTNFAAGFTTSDIQDQAKELSKSIVNKRDEILDAQGMLLSFHDIKGPKFTETMKSVADFATFYKEDMTQAALQVGKAINDPLKGMTRLQRMGVEFSKEQKTQIANYVQQGNLAKAQEVILKELRTEFGGQAQAFALTDAGKIQTAAKQWEELQFSIGEIISRVEVSLIPSFTKVVNAIKMAFNSDVIQFFIAHIKDLVSIVLKIIPIWVTYRAIMAANAAITGIFAVENGVLTASMGSLTFMTDGATVAMEGFKTMLASIGWGAFAIGIGFAVEKILSMNNALQATIDKKYELNANNSFFKEQDEKYDDIKSRAELAATMKGKEGLQLKRGIATDIQGYISGYESKKKQLIHDYTKLSHDNAINKYHGSRYGKLSGWIPFGPGYQQDTKDDKTSEAYKDFSNKMDIINRHIGDLKDVLKSKGYKGIKPISPNGGGHSEDANNISNLSGANGGLGQAKIVNVHINTLQQNNGVHESKSKADDTVRMLTEMINGFSASENAQ